MPETVECKECVELLKKWIEDKCLVQESVVSFWIAFSNAKQNDIVEHKSIFGIENDSAVSLQDVSVSLVLRNWTESDYARLIVAHDICFNNKVLGYYKAVFTLSGEWDDDVLFYSP